MTVSSERASSVSEERSGWKSTHHLVLMVIPNLLNPRKLVANIRHPLREVFHTSHKQYPIEMNEGLNIMLLNIEDLANWKLLTSCPRIHSHRD